MPLETRPRQFGGGGLFYKFRPIYSRQTVQILLAVITPQVLFAAAEVNPLEALRSLDLEQVLLPVLCQLVVIVAASRIFSVLFRKLWQPGVVGEIAAGIALGPSVLGYFLPGVQQAIFHPHLAGVDPALFDALLKWIFSILSQLGLIFVLFLIGLEFDFSDLRRHSRAAVAISTTGVLLPFGLGVALAWPLSSYAVVRSGDQAVVAPLLGLGLFLGTALSITAIPVLGRIMLELGINRSKLGAVTITAAAIDDAIGWILLSSVAAIVAGRFEISGVLVRAGLTVAFAATMIFVARPLLMRWASASLRRGDGGLGANDMAILLVAIFLASIATNLIGIFAVFGAFLTGATLSSHHDFREAVISRMRDFMSVFFLPIFFTYTGLRTEIGSLDSIWLWILCGIVIAAAVAGKLIGCGLAARASGISMRESLCIGVMMNTRGLVGLIVTNLGYEIHVIPKSIYCMLVLTALVTTAMTTPMLMLLMRGTELEPYIRRSWLRSSGETQKGVRD